MLTLRSRLQPNLGEVASEIIDGEAILINVSSGVYYSMDALGTTAWALIAQGYTLEEIVAEIVAGYDVSRDRAETDVQRLADDLLRESLVVLGDEEAPRHRDTPSPQHSRAPYGPPTLNIYRDMQALLALDPPMPELANLVRKNRAEEPSR